MGFCKRRKITREARLLYPDKWTQSLVTPAGQHHHRTEHITVSQIRWWWWGGGGGGLWKEKSLAREKKFKVKLESFITIQITGPRVGRLL